MKKWIIFISVFIVTLCICIGLLVFLKAYKPYSQAEETATQIALDNNMLEEVHDAYVYNGKNSYVTVIGVDENGEERAIFIPKGDSDAKAKDVLMKDGISKEDALAVVENEDDVKEILHIKLGLEDPGAVWEVTYLNHDDKLNYVYIMFDNGQWWKRILNL